MFTTEAKGEKQIHRDPLSIYICRTGMQSRVSLLAQVKGINQSDAFISIHPVFPFPRNTVSFVQNHPLTRSNQSKIFRMQARNNGRESPSPCYLSSSSDTVRRGEWPERIAYLPAPK
ncbi:uncharacterized protein RAG0_07039 [Rhynchosporium agropyri]|uniref:Uncharacterized protein n=1 Tax=Rhynchosporium agropyri TaxID=914238 RepID=A0A1E1KJN3_9HELO|nr:uncharacterized protein RAG0_07039 [Rhynchosporium agropyri]